MPKRIILIALAAVATLAACNSANINNLYGSATATPGPTSTPYVNPSASAATVYVYAASTALPAQTVDLYNSTTAGQQVGTVPIATQTTSPSGVAVFGNLTPTAWYCFATTYAPPSTPAPIPATQEKCINYWGDNAGVTFSF